MESKIAGALALIMLLIFLGNYMIKIASWPLGAIIVAVLAMATYDYFSATRGNTSSDR